MEKIETKQNWTKDYFGNYLVVSNGIVIFGMVPAPESGIYIMETQVAQELYQTVIGNNPSHHKGEKHPVENVRMNDVKAFIKELNDLTNLSFILPTAKEWTKASNRKSSYKYADSDDLDSIAWYGENSNGHTHPVKQKRPNRLGLYDMCGNVYEWTSSETYRGALSLAQMTMPALKDKQPQICIGMRQRLRSPTVGRKSCQHHIPTPRKDSGSPPSVYPEDVLKLCEEEP